MAEHSEGMAWRSTAKAQQREAKTSKGRAMRSEGIAQHSVAKAGPGQGLAKLGAAWQRKGIVPPALLNL